MPTLAVNNFNIVCASLGGFITLFGLVSYLMKEKYYLSEACKSLFPKLDLENVAQIIPASKYILIRVFQ
jgi:hypothetical protein